MRIAIILLFVLLIYGCVSVKIIGSEVIRETKEEIEVLLVTRENLQNYVNSWCVHDVYLSYFVEPMDVERQHGSQAKVWDFPFSVFDFSDTKCPARYENTSYCSSWVVKKVDKVHINNIAYNYSIGGPSIFNFKVGGGNMLGCSLSSNVFKFKYGK
jgi:hypothetical protein